MKNLNELIKEEWEKYEKVKEQLDIKKADGDLAVMSNLMQEFDETFDSFFDNIRDKYENEDDEILSNSEIEAKMDDEDKEKYLTFIKNYTEDLEDELNS